MASLLPRHGIPLSIQDIKGLLSEGWVMGQKSSLRATPRPLYEGLNVLCSQVFSIRTHASQGARFEVTDARFEVTKCKV